MKKRIKPSIRKAKNKNELNYTGIHLLVDFWASKNIKDPKEVEKILAAATKKANNNALNIFVHKFRPGGLTGIVLLAESHIAIHTWPEINYIAIDIFTCGQKAMPYKALEYLRKKLCPKKIKIKEIRRGKL